MTAFQNNDKRHRVCSNLFLHLDPSIVRSVLNLQPGQQSKKRAPAAAHLIETIRWGLLQLSRATGSKAWRGGAISACSIYTSVTVNMTYLLVPCSRPAWSTGFSFFKLVNLGRRGRVAVSIVLCTKAARDAA